MRTEKLRIQEEPCAIIIQAGSQKTCNQYSEIMEHCKPCNGSASSRFSKLKYFQPLYK